MSDLRLVIFDVDGTLVDSQAHIMGAAHAAFDAVELPRPERAAILGCVGLSLPVMMERLAGAAHAEALTEAYRNAYAHARDNEQDQTALYPGTREMLTRLHAEPDTLLAVATGKSARGLDALLSAQDLRGIFISRQTADFHPSKPHPSMLLCVLSETGIAPERAVMVGDTSFDMEMARAAGIASIGVPWGYHPADQLGADQMIQDWDQLDAAIALALEVA